MCDEIDEAGDPINVGDAKKILDLFNWDNFEHMELRFSGIDDANSRDTRYHISKIMSYTVIIRRGQKPYPEDLDFKMTHDIFTLLQVIVHFKDTKKCINLNLETHVLKLSGGLCITMDQIKEKIGFPLRKILIESY